MVCIARTTITNQPTASTNFETISLIYKVEDNVIHFYILKNVIFKLDFRLVAAWIDSIVPTEL